MFAAEPAPVVARSAGEFVTALLLHPDMPAGLALAAGLLAFVGSQVPQAHAPLVTTDGFDRPDLLQFAALGLDRVQASLAAVVILALAFVLGVTRWLAARDGGALPLAASQEGAVKALQRAWQSAGLGERPLAVVERGGRIVVHAGLLRLGPALLAAAGAATVLGGLLAGELEAPVFVDVPLGAETVRVDAAVADAGALGAAPGRWRGRCVRGEALQCQLEWPGGTGSATLAPGHAVLLGDRLVTWIANGTEPAGAAVTLRWQRTAEQPPLGLHLHAGQPVAAPDLGLRLVPVATDVAGAAVLTLPQAGAERPLRALASPLVAPGKPVATARMGERVRLLVAPARPVWVVTAVAVLAAVGFVCAFAVPGLYASVDGQGNVSRLRCNRRRVLAALPGP